MTIETAIEYFMTDPIRTLVQLPAYALMIGVPIWLVKRWNDKRMVKKRNQMEPKS